MEIEENGLKKYIASINKIIKSGNPKYLPYISKEYARLSSSNPMLADTIQGIITTQARKPGSIYAILLDSDGSINLNSISNLSKVSNVAELSKNVDALSAQHVDFGEITSNELIIEGMEIAEELARELESMDNSFDYESDNIDESDIINIESKADTALQDASKMGNAGAGILAILAMVRNRISSILNKIRIGKNKKEQKETEKRADEKNTKNDDIKKEEYKKNLKKVKDSGEKDNWIPKIATPKISLEKNGKKGTNRKKKDDLFTDDDYDATDDFDGTDDNNDNTQEDDEPDI